MSALEDLTDEFGEEQIDLEEAIASAPGHTDLMMSPEAIEKALIEEALPTRKRGRGFAGMTPERRREVAAKGGSSVKPHNRSFARDNALASRAGALGGQKSAGGGRRKKVTD